MAIKSVNKIIAAYSQYQEVLDKINDTIDRIKRLFPYFYYSDTEFKHWSEMEIRHLGHATEFEWEETHPEVLTVSNTDPLYEYERYTISIPIKFLLMDDVELNAALNPYRENYQAYLNELKQDKAKQAKLNREKELKLLKELKAKYPAGE